MANGTNSSGVTKATSSINQAVADFDPNSVVAPSIQDVINGDTMPKGGIPFSDFQNMSDDEKADVIAKAKMVNPPIFLDNSDMQKFSYFTGMNAKPDVVADSKLDGMKGQEIFRTVNDAYNSRTDIGYSAKEIYQQIAQGDFTMYSDSGGSVHGKAIYFASNYADSSYYAAGRNPNTMRAKYKSDAKVITESQLDKIVSQEKAKNSKLYQATKGNSQKSLIAVAKGYDAYYSGSYHMVLNRGALAMSDTIKPTVVGGRW